MIANTIAFLPFLCNSQIVKHIATWERENFYHEQNAQIIVGLDEVGRGCWAGPIVAAVYAFNYPFIEIELTDSKLLNDQKRQTLYLELQSLGMYGIGESSATEIDQIGLQAAQYLAYTRALEQFPHTPDIILLDGRPWSDCIYPHEAIVKGDQKSASIAAASIMAKVHRDRLMRETYHDQYVNYGFNLHVGYGTKLHQEAIKTFGVTPIHRTSYKPIQAILKLKST